jgi:hypothetical protein
MMVTNMSVSSSTLKSKSAPKRKRLRQALPFANSKYSKATATLQYWDAERKVMIELQLDSEAWFTWLAGEQSFRFTYWHEAGIFVNFTVRPEKRRQRTYWQGWKTIQGQTIKKYIAPSANMTKAKLDTVGAWFFEQVKTRSPDDPSMNYYITIVDLTALVEKLIHHCQNPAMVEQARRELERINRQVGN